jgi:hypothetical protein
MGHQASSFHCILSWIHLPALLAKAPGAARPQPCFRMLLRRIRSLSSVLLGFALDLGMLYSAKGELKMASALCIRRRNAKGDVTPAQRVCVTPRRLKRI